MGIWRILWFYDFMIFNNSKIKIKNYIGFYYIFSRFGKKCWGKLENKNLKYWRRMGFWNNKKQFGKSCFTICVCVGGGFCSYLNFSLFFLLSVEKPRDGKFIVYKSNGKVKWKVLSVCICVFVYLAIKATDFWMFFTFWSCIFWLLLHMFWSTHIRQLYVDGMYRMQEL